MAYFFRLRGELNGFCFIQRDMRSHLVTEISRSGRRRWLQVKEMPFSRAITYKLISAGLISSVVVTWPGSRRGRRLIDGDSLDSLSGKLNSETGFGRRETQCSRITPDLR